MRGIYLTSLAVIGLAACSGHVDVDPDGPVVTMDDLRAIEGDNWTGTLSYLDYSSGKNVTIKAAATVEIVSDTKLKYSVSYPQEPWEDAKSTLKISQSGRVLDGHEVEVRQKYDEVDGLIIQTVHQGEDDNRPAEIRMSYTVSGSKFLILKGVRFEGEDRPIVRNMYSFSRP